MQPAAQNFVTTFLAHSDGVAKTTLFFLLLMSVASWYLIMAKFAQNWITQRRANAFLKFFWEAPSLAAVAAHLKQSQVRDAFSMLTRQGLQAAEHHRRYAGQRLAEAGDSADFITRALRRVIGKETARLESGLTVLASVGSIAPFVGLFGTVWSIYNALTAIGVAGQGTLDKVAGPVGEALIMTAAGLAVAIPAVLAYNFAVRGNRVFLAELDGFAHDLFTFLTTGARVINLPVEHRRADAGEAKANAESGAAA